MAANAAPSAAVARRMSVVMLRTLRQGPRDLPELRLAEGSHRLSANVALHSHSECHPRDGLVVWHIGNSYKVVLSQSEIDRFELAARLLIRLFGCINSRGRVLDAADSLLSVAQQRDVRGHPILPRGEKLRYHVSFI